MSNITNYTADQLLILAEQLRNELNDARLRDEDGIPFEAISDPQPAVEFLDAARSRRALLEEAPGNRWLLQFFDKTGSLMASRSGQLQQA